MGKDGQGSQKEHCFLCFFDWVLSVCRSWYPWGHHCPGAGQPLARGRNDATGLKWLRLGGMWLYVDYPSKSGYEVNVPFRGHHEGFAVLLCFAYLHPTRCHSYIQLRYWLSTSLWAKQTGDRPLDCLMPFQQDLKEKMFEPNTVSFNAATAAWHGLSKMEEIERAREREREHATVVGPSWCHKSCPCHVCLRKSL